MTPNNKIYAFPSLVVVLTLSLASYHLTEVVIVKKVKHFSYGSILHSIKHEVVKKYYQKHCGRTFTRKKRNRVKHSEEGNKRKILCCLVE